MEPPAWILKNAMKVLKVALMEDLSAISLVTLLFMHIKGFHGLWKYAIDKIEGICKFSTTISTLSLEAV